LTPKLVDIPAGEFWMGCETGRADERPVHRVWVNAIAMSATTVTNCEYQWFAGDTNRGMPEAFSLPAFGNPLQPVVAVSWFDARAYCHWLTRKTRKFFRLPTEAEWEWAIRCGREKALFAWGDEPPEGFDLYRNGWKDERPHVVALQPTNAFGLYDLGDNVHEWCLDWYDPISYAQSVFANPVSTRASLRRSSRGGSWRHRIKVSRCAARSSLPPGSAYTDYGFRVVQAAETLECNLAWS